jgi:ATP-binding cassette subfamily B protein
MKITYQFRKNIASKISRMPMQFFDRQTHGEILSRVTNDVDLVGNTLSQSLTQIISAVVTVLGVLVMMLTINWLMTAAVLLMVPLSTGLIAFVVKRSQKYFSRQQKILGQLNGHVEEMYSGHVVMKAFNGEAESIKTFSKLNTSLHETAWKSQFMSGMMHPIMNFIGNIGYVAICILGGWLVIKKTIAVGDIQAFIQYMRSFTQPLAQIAGTTNMLQSTLAAAERVFEFIDEPEEIPDSSESVQTDLLSGSVIFDHVQFGYLPGQTVIRNFSASIKPGQKVAIVGPTGAGKTTLVKLLMRFYDVDSGSIKLDQHDIRSFTRSDLRSQFGMVLQDTWLFNGTIRDNIRYGQLDASDEEIEQAARAAYVNHFIHTLPHGFDMVLNEDASNISQGQKQLLTIARAILSDPKILILDEATSSVDTRTEILIQQAMNELMKGKTSFIIAHRLSTIRNADLILVLRDGDIVEQGTHDELLAADGFYADLYNSQFEQSSAAVNS